MKQILTDLYALYFGTIVEAKDSGAAVEAAGRQQAGGGSAAASGGTGGRQAAAVQRQAAAGHGQTNGSSLSTITEDSEASSAQGPKASSRGSGWDFLTMSECDFF